MFFHGGMLPTKGTLKVLAKNNDLSFKEYISFGKDYAKTLSLWKKKFSFELEKYRKTGF